MVALSYRQIALGWHPEAEQNGRFRLINLATLVLVVMLAAAVSLIDVPKEERRERAVVPERIARFVSQRKPPPPPKPEIKPEPVLPPPPVVEQPPRVVRERPAEKAKPLTEEQKEARKVAEDSGLLALRSEMASLIGSASEARAALGGDLSVGEGADLVAGHDANIITAGTAGGSGGVDGSKIAMPGTHTQLKAGEIAQVLDGLADVEDEEVATAGTGERAPGGRSKEDVSMVFDQNKGALYALYERQRRKTLGLEGTVVLELTVAPSGDVTAVRIVSSDLNSPALEARLIARIKQFSFGAMDSPPLTVIFPIEFLPS